MEGSIPDEENKTEGYWLAMGNARETGQPITPEEIAELLDISVKTVETHRSHLMEKLNLHSISDLVRYAVRNELIQS